MVGLCLLVALVRFFKVMPSFHIERFMLPVEAPHFAVPLRIVLWQHLGDLKPLDGITIEKLPACAGALTQDPELVCQTASH